MVTIIIVNYNNHNDTINCLKSICDQSYKHISVVVVDNASKNQNRLHDLLTKYMRVHLICNSQNMGFGKANNIGYEWAIKNISSEYIFFLNNDTKMAENCIREMINCIEQKANTDTVMITPKIITMDEEPSIWYGGGSIDYNRMTAKMHHITEPDHKLEDGYTDFASGCAMFFKATYLKGKIVFDDCFFMYDEDLELCMRIKKEGKKIYFTNSAVVYHKCQGSQENESSKKLNQLHPNNKNLKFLLNNTIPNRFYIINKYFFSKEKMILKYKLTRYWLLKSIQYFLYGKIKLSLYTIRLLISSI